MAAEHRTHRLKSWSMFSRVLYVVFCIILLTFGAEAAGTQRRHHRHRHHGRHHHTHTPGEEESTPAPTPEEGSGSPDAISYYSANTPLEVRFTETAKEEDGYSESATSASEEAATAPTVSDVPMETATESSSEVEVQSEVETPQPPEDSSVSPPVALEEESAAAAADDDAADSSSASPPAVSQDPAPAPGGPKTFDPLTSDMSLPDPASSTDDDVSDEAQTELSELSASEEGIGKISADPNHISMSTIAFGIIIASAFIFGCISFAVYHRYTKDNYSTYERHVARTFDPDI